MSKLLKNKWIKLLVFLNVLFLLVFAFSIFLFCCDVWDFGKSGVAGQKGSNTSWGYISAGMFLAGGCMGFWFWEAKVFAGKWISSAETIIANDLKHFKMEIPKGKYKLKLENPHLKTKE